MSLREKLKEITNRDVGYLDGASYTLCTKSCNARAEKKKHNERDEKASILSTTISVIVKFLKEGLYVVLCG